MSCFKTTSRCALVGWSLSSTICLGLAIILLVVCFIGQNSKPASPCHGNWGPNVYLHRGNLNLAQENTAEAIAGGIPEGIWPEMDILATSDSTPHLFHDKNALRLTGVDRAFTDISPEELASDSGTGSGSITNQAVIDGYDYEQTRPIPTAESVLKEICALDPSAPMDLDIKDQKSALKMADILVSSGCDLAAPSSGIVIAMGDPFIISNYKAKAPTEVSSIRVSLFLHPGTLPPPGLYFFLKTRFMHWYAGADMISAHYSVWDKDYDLIRGYEEDGYCSAVYGIPNSEEALARYPSASYYIVDEGPYFPNNPNGQFGGDGSEDEVVYDGSRGGYIGMVTVGFLSLFMCLLSAWMVYRNRSHCCFGCGKKKHDDESDGNKIETDKEELGESQKQEELEMAYAEGELVDAQEEVKIANEREPINATVY